MGRGGGTVELFIRVEGSATKTLCQLIQRRCHRHIVGTGQMITFILVHGTFAKQAPWTRADSPLGIRLAGLAAETGQSARIRAVEWSGKNLERDRWAAANAIADQISRCRGDFPSDAIFLIGHSHGGSAIAYFLKSRPELRTAVTGCALPQSG